MNAGIQETTLVEKVLAGQRISAEEALELYHLPLQELGALADHRRSMAKNGRVRSAWQRDRHLHHRA